jgi:hypothetical protein
MAMSESVGDTRYGPNREWRPALSAPRNLDEQRSLAGRAL